MLSLFSKKDKDNVKKNQQGPNIIPSPPRQPYMGSYPSNNSPRQQYMNPNPNMGQPPRGYPPPVNQYFRPPFNPNNNRTISNPNTRPAQLDSINNSDLNEEVLTLSNTKDELEKQVKDLFNQLTIARLERKEDKRLSRRLSIKNSELLVQVDEAKRAIADMQSVLKTVQTATNDITRQRDLREKDFQRIIKENRDLQKLVAEDRESLSRTFELENKIKDGELALRTLAHNKDDIIRRMNEQISLNHEIAMKSQGEAIRARGEKQVMEAEIGNLHEQIALMQDASYRVQTENLKLKGEKVMVESELQTWKNKINTLELRLKRQVQKDFKKEVMETMKEEENDNNSLQVFSGAMDQTRNLIKKDFNLLENKIEGLEKIMQNALYERLSAVENQLRSNKDSPCHTNNQASPYSPGTNHAPPYSPGVNGDNGRGRSYSIISNNDDTSTGRKNSISGNFDDASQTSQNSPTMAHTNDDDINPEQRNKKFRIGLHGIINSMKTLSGDKKDRNNLKKRVILKNAYLGSNDQDN